MGLYDCEVGTYVGNNVNSRTIPTGVDFDFALVMCGEGRTNTQDHGVFGLYVAGFIQWSYNNGSANCMRNESGPGTSDRFGGKSGENILLGSTGNNVMNSNYTGWDYAWIAIDFS